MSLSHPRKTTDNIKSWCVFFSNNIEARKLKLSSKALIEKKIKEKNKQTKINSKAVTKQCAQFSLNPNQISFAKWNQGKFN